MGRVVARRSMLSLCARVAAGTLYTCEPRSCRVRSQIRAPVPGEGVRRRPRELKCESPKKTLQQIRSHDSPRAWPSRSRRSSYSSDATARPPASLHITPSAEFGLGVRKRKTRCRAMTTSPPPPAPPPAPAPPRVKLQMVSASVMLDFSRCAAR
eukprot:scaffold117180_cov62-Phaeocystis_antarctica.AAC.5